MNEGTYNTQTSKCEKCTYPFKGDDCSINIPQHYLVYNNNRSFEEKDIPIISKKYEGVLASYDEMVNVSKNLNTTWCNNGYTRKSDGFGIYKMGPECEPKYQKNTNTGIILFGGKPPENSLLTDGDIIAPFNQKSSDSDVKKDGWNNPLLVPLDIKICTIS